MATAEDLARLLVSIEFSQKQSEKQLAAIAKAAATSAKGIEDRFRQANDNVGKSFQSGEKKVVQSVGAQRAAVQNLSFQLNDIATSLSGGASPFTVMMQQGSQVAQVLSGAGGVSGAVSTIGGAFASVVNPVSLLTFAVIGLGGAAAQYFASMLSGGADSAKVLEEQARLIQQLADRWGDAVPALREYADELKRAKEAGELQEGLTILKDRDLADIRGKVDEARATIADLVSQLQTAGEESESILSLQRAFNDFTSAADDGRDVTSEVKQVQDALAVAIESTGIPALANFSAMFEQLAASAQNASAGVQAAAAAAAQAQARMNDPSTWRSFGRTDQNADGTIQGAGTVLPDNGPSPERRPLIELEGLPSSGGGGRKRGGGKSEAEREAEAVRKLIEALEHERSLLGQTDAQRRVANELRKAGTSATEAQKARITELVTAITAEQDAIKRNEAAMRDLQAVGKDVLGGFISDLRNGKSAAEALSGALDRVMSKLIDGALESLFSGSGGGILGGLFGSIFGFAKGGVASNGRPQPLKTFARGGVSRSAAIFGEAGPEAAVPLPDGRSIPVKFHEPSVPKRAAAAAQNMHITVGVSADNNGNLMPFVESVSDSQVKKAAPGIVSAANQRVVPTMAAYQSNKAGAEWR